MGYNKIDYPLVSVVVATYNSSVTVLETLESIKTQTYPDIELIVTDDCSTDHTIDIVNGWIGEFRDRFVHAELVTTEKNTGVSGNFNRGIRCSHGEWIKSIAGDDLLIPTAIEEYVAFVVKHPEHIRFCVCDVEPFSTDGTLPVYITKGYERFFELESETYEQQRNRVMTELAFVGPSYFYTRKLFDRVGGFSEEYGNTEEWPFVYKIIMGGNRIYTLNRKLIRYRYQPTSLSRGLMSKSFFLGMYRHFFDHAFKDLVHDGRPFTAWHYALSYWSRRLMYHINNKSLRKVVEIGVFVFSPLAYLNRIKYCLEKNGTIFHFHLLLQ